jgi:peptide/nickel transport system substrate-binding protein
LSCETSDYPAFSYIGWNADKPLFSDRKVRTAMTLALDRKRLVETVFVGLGSVACGPYLPSRGHLDPELKPLPFDLERARSLLNEAGWSDTDGDGLLDKVLSGRRTPFEFTLLIFGGSSEYTSLANVFKEDLLKLGVRMKIEAAEWSLMQKRMDEKKFDAFTGAWGLSWDADPYQIWHSSQADVPKGSNRVGFRNAEADQLIEKLRETFEPEARTKLFRQLHRIIYHAQPYTFLRVVKAAYCWSREVEGVVFAKAQPITDSNPWWVTREQ